MASKEGKGTCQIRPIANSALRMGGNERSGKGIVSRCLREATEDWLLRAWKVRQQAVAFVQLEELADSAQLSNGSNHS